MKSRTFAAALFAIATLLISQSALAHDHGKSHQDDKTPYGWARYGFSGLWMGARTGLAVGHLAAGPSYEKGEWRQAAGGAAIGALAGLGTGLIMKAIDGDGPKPHRGWYVIRGGSIGLTVGGLGGLAVGGIVALESSKARDMLTGAAIGGLGGAAVGVIIGIIRGAHAEAAASNEVALTVGYSPDTGTPMPALMGRF